METASRRGATRLDAHSQAEAQRATELLATGRRLTAKQARVVRLRAAGLSYAEIAASLQCSETTVRAHCSTPDMGARHDRLRCLDSRFDARCRAKKQPALPSFAQRFTMEWGRSSTRRGRHYWVNTSRDPA
jgi:FixJ family two-component response regulator